MIVRTDKKRTQFNDRRGSNLNELKLICSLFDQEVEHTLDFLAALKPEQWQFVSSPWDGFLFHGLATNVSVADITKHVITLEHSIVRIIKSNDNDSVISQEGDSTLCENLSDYNEIVPFYKSVHQENLERIKSFKQQDLDKTLTFVNQKYTGTGLLWMITGHHALHLGQLKSIQFPGT